MNKKPTKINLTSDDSLFEKSLNLQKYIEDLSSQAINLTDKFSFTWAGKSNAIKSVLIPSKLTLNPEPKQSIKWDESENLFIEGDNLEVLKLLQKAYFEKVKMIYIDPPYNTGHDFVYNDDFSSSIDNYLKQTGQKSESGESNTTNKETNGRYHSDWLSMMYPRLKLAWNLLREDGVIFVSIDDNEVHHLRMIMNEIFGEENFVANFIWHSSTGGGIRRKFVNQSHQYVLCYAKSIDNVEMFFAPLSEDAKKQYKKEDDKGVYREKDFAWKNSSWGTNQKYLIQCPDGEKVRPKEGYLFRFIRETFDENLKNDMVVFKKTKNGPLINEKGEQANWNIYIKKYLGDGTGAPSSVIPRELVGINNEGTTELNQIFSASLFDSPKNVRLLTYLISFFDCDNSSIILDFFAGSGSTAHAVLEQNQEDSGNRKFICVQLPEKLEEDSEGFKAGYKTIADIAKERIRRVIKGYGDEPKPMDSGFKVFTLSESNYPENSFVFNPEKSSEENQQAFITYLNKAKQSQLFDKEDDISIVYENIVKEGLSLNSKVETITIGKNNMYKVTDGEKHLLVCLENKLAPETVKELTDKSHKDKLFICLESSLDDTTTANLSLNLDLKTI